MQAVHAEVLRQTPEAQEPIQLDNATTMGRLSVALANLDQPYDNSDWREDALCAGEEPEIFFSRGNAGLKGSEAEKPLDVCSRCTVVEDCLKSALRRKDRHAIMGATTVLQRKKALKAFEALQAES